MNGNNLLNLLVIILGVLVVSYFLSCMFTPKRRVSYGGKMMRCPCCRRMLRRRCMMMNPCAPRMGCIYEKFEGGRGSEYEAAEGTEVEEIPAEETEEATE